MFELIKPFKESRTLVKFIYGNSNIYATTWKSPINWQGNVYQSEPGISIEMPKQSGGLNEDPLKVDLPLTRSKVNAGLQTMAAEIASTRATPKTRIEVYMQIVDGPDQRILYLYEGTLDRSRSNPDGREGVVSMEFASELRYGLDRIAIGRRCDPECDLIFGGSGCQHISAGADVLFGDPTYYPNHVAEAAIEVCSGWVDVTVDPANARKVALSLNEANHPEPGSPPPAGWRELTLSEQNEGWWLGSFIKDLNGTGLSISIQSWEQGTNEFVLAQLPPKTWDGSLKFLQIDCPRTATACAERFNTLNFGALGYGIPTYNPSIDLPNNE